MMTRLLLFHLASGQAFFSGAACLVLAVVLAPRAGRRWARVARDLLAGVGGVLVAASAAPLPAAAYWGLGAVAVAWLAGESRRDRRPRRLRVLRGAMATAWAAAALAEAPYHLAPRVPPLGRPVVGVIGDSVTAGVGDRAEVTWPRLLAGRHGVAVRDHSEAGATATSAAARQAPAVGPDERLVIVEVGGNDLLGGATPGAFEAGLARLLDRIVRPGRVVVLLELPLPPTYAEFGRAQRRLARRAGALLVPRRALLGVLLAEGATLDTIHPSALGHARLADAIWDVIRPAFAAPTGRPGAAQGRSGSNPN